MRYTYFGDLSLRLYVAGPEAMLDMGTPEGWRLTLLTWEDPTFVRAEFEREEQCQS